MNIIFRKTNPRQRVRGNKTMGRIALVVIFLCLAAINYAATAVLPYTGIYTAYYQGLLFLGTVWSAILLVAIGYKQGWARVILIVFLLGFVAVQLVFLPDVIQRYPNFWENCLRIVLLHWVAHIGAAIYLLVSVDIRWLLRGGINE